MEMAKTLRRLRVVAVVPEERRAGGRLLRRHHRHRRPAVARPRPRGCSRCRCRSRASSCWARGQPPAWDRCWHSRWSRRSSSWPCRRSSPRTFPLLDALVYALCAFAGAAVFFSLAFLFSSMFGNVWAPALLALCAGAALRAVDEATGGTGGFSLLQMMHGESYFRRPGSAVADAARQRGAVVGAHLRGSPAHGPPGLLELSQASQRRNRHA